MDNQNQRVMANESKCTYSSIKAYSSGTGLNGWNFNNFDKDLRDYSPYQVLVLFQIGNHGWYAGELGCSCWWKNKQDGKMN